jgi:hypothetical protein
VVVIRWWCRLLRCRRAHAIAAAAAAVETAARERGCALVVLLCSWTGGLCVCVPVLLRGGVCDPSGTRASTRGNRHFAHESITFLLTKCITSSPAAGLTTACAVQLTVSGPHWQRAAACSRAEKASLSPPLDLLLRRPVAANHTRQQQQP